MLAVAAVPPTLMRRVRWPLYAFVLLSTAAVLAAGTSVGGGKRWINLGAFQFQPSEFAKLLLIVGLAAVLASRRGVTGPARLTLLAIAYIAAAGAARVQGARLRHHARVRRDHARDALRLRHPLAALRVDGDRGGGDRRARVLDPAGDGRAGRARLPDLTPDRLPAPQPQRHPGQRLPAAPVGDRGLARRAGRHRDRRRRRRARHRSAPRRRRSASCPRRPPTSCSRSSARSADSWAPPG